MNFRNQFQIGQANITADSFETRTKEEVQATKMKLSDSKTVTLTKDRPNSSTLKNHNGGNFAIEQYNGNDSQQPRAKNPLQKDQGQ